MKQVKTRIIAVTLSILLGISGPVQVSDVGNHYAEAKKHVTYVLMTRTGKCYHTHKCGNGTYYRAALAELISLTLPFSTTKVTLSPTVFISCGIRMVDWRIFQREKRK